jgi:hypothetical protein
MSIQPTSVTNNGEISMDEKIKKLEKDIPAKGKTKKVKKEFMSLLKADKKMDREVEMCEHKKRPMKKK